MYDLSKFSERLRIGRTAKNLSQRQLAFKIGVDPRYISDYETKGRMPSAENLMKLANVLTLPAGYLLGGNYYD